jgi:hypothetical protein
MIKIMLLKNRNVSGCESSGTALEEPLRVISRLRRLFVMGNSFAGAETD